MARHLRDPLVLTDGQLLEVEEQLASAGIVDGDMVTSIQTLCARAPIGLTYADWRAHLAAMSGASTEAEQAAMAKTYGHDAVRAARVLSKKAWS